MGKVIGGNLILGRGISQGTLPEFIKDNLTKVSLTYEIIDGEHVADISKLTRESYYYLKMKEIIRRTKDTTIVEDALNLAKLLKQIAEEYVNELEEYYSVLVQTSTAIESHLREEPVSTELDKSHLGAEINNIVDLTTRSLSTIYFDKTTAEVALI